MMGVDLLEGRLCSQLGDMHSDEYSYPTITYRSVCIVELIAYDGANPLEGLLRPQPGRHACVDDHSYLAIVRLVQA
jgi:hypothetical protein